MKNLAIGAISGVLATIPMSWAMEMMHRLLPWHERHPLPPRQISERVTELLGMSGQLSDEQQLWLSLASHLGYGAAMGAAYAPLARKFSLPPLAKGTIFGLAVWTGSYLGLLPALGILTPAARHPMRRNALMIIAHLVWGSAAAIFTDSMETGRKREHLEFLGGRGSARRSEKQYS